MAIDTTFLEDLASKAPTPGGGGASAYAGALAASLSSMVGHLTLGKKSYADVEPQIQESLATLEDMRARLVSLIDADAEAFLPLSDSYRMPHETPEECAAKNECLQKALDGACLVPLQIMSVSAAVIAEADFLAHNGSKLARSDAGASAYLAQAAVHAASLNVYINAASMEDKERAAQLLAQADMLREQADKEAQAVCAFVMECIRPKE